MHSDRITNRSSSGLAASLVISSNPAVLYGLTIYNGKATAQYIQLHDAASLPADASTPITRQFLSDLEKQRAFFPRRENI